MESNVQCACSNSHRTSFSWIFAIHLDISRCTKVYPRYLEKDKQKRLRNRKEVRNRLQYRKYPKHLISNTRPPLCKSARRTRYLIGYLPRTSIEKNNARLSILCGNIARLSGQLDRKLFRLRRKKLCISRERIIRLFMPRLEYGKHQSFNSVIRSVRIILTICA